MIMTPHYHLVPKGIEANLRFRRELLSKAGVDESFAATLLKMCEEDILFYFNAFLWTYDPRDQKFPDKPFITYKEFQDEVILEAVDAIENGYDIAWPKSRTMGASWMGLSIFEWFWHFRKSLAFLLISRNEDYVDKAGNKKSLFWKIDYLHTKQPLWLLPTGRHLRSKDPNRKILHLKNEDNGSTIDGESTTGDAGRGDRRTAVFIDEYAAFEHGDGYKALSSTRDTSKCRIFNSTPQGAANAFYDVCHKTSARVTKLHWSRHPEYNKGLYSVDPKGKVTLLDDWTGVVSVNRIGWKEPKDFVYPEAYPFITGTPRVRSPWYDNECSRCVSEKEIAQELDIDFQGSAYQKFDAFFIKALIKEYCVPELLKGHLIFDKNTLDPEGVSQNEKGSLRLWLTPGGSGSVLTDFECLAGRRFAIGSDVSHGTGASNSASTIVDLTTGEKVGVFVDSNTKPDDFADFNIALAKLFNKAILIWDASGAAGRTYTKRIMDFGYPNIYYRRSEGRVRERISDQPGFFLNPEDRSTLLDDYRRILENRTFINRSKSGMEETLQFIVLPGGKCEHSKSANSIDPTGAREAHGDECIADALASRLLKISPQKLKIPKVEAPYLSPAWRFEQEALQLQADQQENW